MRIAIAIVVLLVGAGVWWNIATRVFVACRTGRLEVTETWFVELARRPAAFVVLFLVQGGAGLLLAYLTATAVWQLIRM